MWVRRLVLMNGRHPRPYVLVASFNLAAHSARTRPRSFTSIPCALAHSRPLVGFGPLTGALRPPRAGRRAPPPARRAALTFCASACRSPGVPGAQVDLIFRAVQREADSTVSLTAIKVIDEEDLHLLRRGTPCGYG